MFHQNHVFLAPIPLRPNPCSNGYMIGCKVNVSWSMEYQKWTLHRISIPMGLRQGPLVGMQRLHFQYASFTPPIWLGPDSNWNHFHGNKMDQATWKGKFGLQREVMFPSKWLEKIYRNHWTSTTKCPRVVLPCSHHVRTDGGPTNANPIPHPESRGGRLFLPPDCRIGGDYNWKFIHEGRALHLLIEG